MKINNLMRRASRILSGNDKILKAFMTLERNLLSAFPIFRSDGSLIDEENEKRTIFRSDGSLIDKNNEKRIKFLFKKLKIKGDPAEIKNNGLLNIFLSKARKKIKKRLLRMK